MVTTMRGVLNRLREHSIKLRRQLDDFTSESRAILAVTSNFAVKSNLRVLSLEQGWRILFADCLEEGLRLQRMNKVWILVYDRNLPDVEWHYGLCALLTSNNVLFPIVLSDVLSCRLRSEVLHCGGYDVARKPLDRKYFAALVNGALALARSIDSLEF
jgi:DNA-binding response OmpR family regulator